MNFFLVFVSPEILKTSRATRRYQIYLILLRGSEAFLLEKKFKVKIREVSR
jgi:hypothetical protein